MKSKIRFGLYGCNMYRTRDLLAGARAAAGDAVEVAASFDIDPAKAAHSAETYGGKACGSEAELLADRNVDVVVICLPPFLHPGAFANAVKAGKDVYLEKPVCVNDRDRDALLEAAAKYPARCYVGLSYRHVAPFRKVAEILRRPEAGRLLGVHHHWLAPEVEEPEAPGWRHRLDQSGGQLIHHCCHLLDWFHWIGGKIGSVVANASTPPTGPLPHEERELTACFNYAAGGMAVFNLSQHSHQYVQFGTVHTENLGIRYQWGHDTFVHVYRTRSRAVDETFEWSMSDRAGDGGDAERNALQMREFIEAYREGRPMPFSIEDGVRTYDLARAARESCRTGCRLDVSRAGLSTHTLPVS